MISLKLLIIMAPENQKMKLSQFIHLGLKLKSLGIMLLYGPCCHQTCGIVKLDGKRMLLYNQLFLTVGMKYRYLAGRRFKRMKVEIAKDSRIFLRRNLMLVAGWMIRNLFLIRLIII